MSAASGENTRDRIVTSTEGADETLYFEDFLLDLLEGYLNYFLQLAFVLIVLRFTRRNNLPEGGIDKDSTDDESSFATNLEIDPWSLRFIAEETRIRYASYVREQVSPAVNKFMAILFFFFSTTKLTRLFDSSHSSYHMVFRSLPKKDIVHNVSTNIHVALFFLWLSRVETNTGWKSCKLCNRWGEKWRTFFIRDVVQATKVLLFFGPYLTIMPGLFFCVQDGDFLPSAQCQHVHWGGKMKHRLFDDRMNSTFKAILNNQENMEVAMSHERSIFKRIQHDYLTRGNNSVGKDFETWLLQTNMSTIIQHYTAGHDGQTYFKFKIVEGIFVEESVRPWHYGRAIEMGSVYSFTILLAYTLVQMATFDCGFSRPCAKKKKLGIVFFFLVNAYSFLWAIFYQLNVPWATTTEILFRPVLYWLCFIIFIYKIERSRREAWSRSEEVRGHLWEKNKMHEHYLEQQNELVSDLMHNYGNMASTIAVCWNEVSELRASFAKKDMSKDIELRFNQSIEKAKSIAEMTHSVVMSSARNLRGEFKYNPTKQNLAKSLKYVPYFTSNYTRFIVSIKDGTPEYIVIDYSIFMVCLTNFVSNAQKYSSGKIVIEASYIDGFVHVDVIDQGVGIPFDQQSLIFQRGEKSRLNKDLAKGQGIGLHSVAKVLKQAGGRVGVASPHRWEYDKEDGAGPGSRFWFEMKDENQKKESLVSQQLLQHVKNDELIEEKKSTMEEENLATYEENVFRVLLVEDNLFIQMATKTSLEKIFSKFPCRCDVTSVPTEDPNNIGALTLKLLTTGSTIYDMVLLDQELGHKNTENGCLYGTDVVNAYWEWIKEQESLRAMGKENQNVLRKMKNQVIHFFSASQIERSFLADKSDLLWLRKCPFSKPLLGHELETFKWKDYPRFSEKQTGCADTNGKHFTIGEEMEEKAR
jgi:signal transduction histidine kinase